MGMVLVILLATTGGAILLGESARRERETAEQIEAARNVAEEARRENLHNAAIFAANAYGNEIERRWRILTELAADTDLQRLIKAAGGKETDSDEFRDLSIWLQDHTEKREFAIRNATWFVTDSNGGQRGFRLGRCGGDARGRFVHRLVAERGGKPGP